MWGRRRKDFRIKKKRERKGSWEWGRGRTISLRRKLGEETAHRSTFAVWEFECSFNGKVIT